MPRIAGAGTMVLAAAMIAAPVMAASLRYALVPLDRLPDPAPSAKMQRPSDILPDGVIATGTGTIRAAWLTGPTRRYAHGVLGDDVEASGLAVRTEGGETLSLSLHFDAVFEDRIPRIVDLNADGRDEVLVVKSDQSAGAALALVAPVDGRLRQIAVGEPIGLAYRWLNPVGVGDFDGDGRIETAHVETPHIGGSLVLSRREGDRLVETRREAGFSNHRMGSRVLGLSMVLDADGDGVPDLLVPDNPRTSLRVVTFAGGVFRELARIDLGAEVRSSLRPANLPGGGLGVAFELSDGRILGLMFRR